VEREFERAEELLASYDAELRRQVPEGTEIFDAHVHLGNDIDGMRGVYEELLRSMDRHGVARAFMFCMDEPDRHPGFRAPNDRTLEYAKQSEGRLIPFVRLDLAESPIEEAERCLDVGARGIKLHPRAQRFLLNDERLALSSRLPPSGACRSSSTAAVAFRRSPTISRGSSRAIPTRS